MILKYVVKSNQECVSPKDCIRDAAVKMKSLGESAIPVTHRGRLIGLITEGDIVEKTVVDGLDPEQAKVEDIMMKDVAFCYDDQDLYDAADQMIHRRIPIVTIVDRRRHVVGICTLGDLARLGANGQIAIDILRAIHGHQELPSQKSSNIPPQTYAIRHDHPDAPSTQ